MRPVRRGGDGIKLVQLAPLRWKKPRRIFMTDLFADFRDGSNEWDNIS
jgi:protein gp37